MNNASFCIDLFNTREKATIIWLLIFGVWALSKKNIRSSFWINIKGLFEKKILVLIMAMLVYIGFIFAILSKIGIWNISLTKDTVFWVLGSAFVLLINVNRAMEDEHHFKKIILDNLKLILIIEFIVNLYTFNFWIELILIPVLFMLVAGSAFTKIKKEKKVIDSILSAFGILLIVFTLVKIFENYQAFASLENLRAFTLPLLLTFAYLPFLYFFALFMSYESLFAHLDFFLKKDLKLAKFAKQKVFTLCHVNLGKLNRFSKGSAQELIRLNNRNDILNMIKTFKRARIAISKEKTIQNIKYFSYSLLLSLFITCMILIVCENSGFIKDFSNKIIDIAIVSFILLFFLHSWSTTQKFWQRYKNTKQLSTQSFISNLDCIILTTALVIIFLLICFLIYSAKPILIFTGVNNIRRIILTFIFIFMWLLLSYFSNKKTGTKSVGNKNISSLSDEPIDNSGRDLLGREKFIDTLYDSIIKLPFEDSFVYGLSGRWGEGKTSVIKLLQNKLEENKEFLIVDFKPWYFNDEETIFTAFYSQLEQALSKEAIFPNIKRTFNKYLKLISVRVPQTDINIKLPHCEETLEDVRDNMQKFIQQTEKKIIIFIDDIDRLERKEVLLVFKLVRLNMNFKNTRFILSFDVDAVRKLLKGSKKEGDFEDAKIDPEFLDKIIQVTTDLPAIEQIYIDQFLYSYIDGRVNRTLLKNILRKYPDKWEQIFDNPNDGYLYFKKGLQENDFVFMTDLKEKAEVIKFWEPYKENLFDKLDVSRIDRAEFRNNFDNLYETQIKTLFKTLRITKRYLNSLCLMLPAVKDEVDLHDFFVLEVIRTFYSTVYEDIWLNQKFYITEKEEENRMPNEIITHINKIVENQQEKDILMKLLKAIFPLVNASYYNAKESKMPDVVAWNREKRKIHHFECFKRYFMLRVPPLEIPDATVKNTLIEWNKDKNKIETSILKFREKDQLLEFFRKISVFRNVINIKEEIIPDIANIVLNKYKKELEVYEYSAAKKLLMELYRDKKVNKFPAIIDTTGNNEFIINNYFLGEKEGTFSIWAKVTDEHNSSTKHMYIIGTASDGGRRIGISASQGTVDFYMNVFAIARMGSKKCWSFWCTNDKGEEKLIDSDSNKALSVGWHLFTVCWSKTKGFVSFYIDTMSINKPKEEKVIESWPVTYGECVIGTWPNRAKEHYFNSEIGYWEIFNKVISEDDIKEIYDEKIKFLP
ncbi:MAG: P-loop NTPase fold protein [bacterium]